VYLVVSSIGPHVYWYYI